MKVKIHHSDYLPAGELDPVFGWGLFYEMITENRKIMAGSISIPRKLFNSVRQKLKFWKIVFEPKQVKNSGK